MELGTADPDVTKVGWIGTGVMGLSMCRHLIDAGYQMTVYSRTRERSAPLLDAGAKWGASPADVASSSDVVFSIVGYPDDVREVHLGQKGTLKTARPETILVDMTTSRPALAGEIFEAARAKNVHSVDAPVSGGDVGAKNGTLSIMIGGEKGAVSAVGPLFEKLGRTIIHQGPAGAGQHTKMANQILIATNMIGVCESLLYAWKSGLDLDTVLQSVSSGAAGSWSLSNLAPRIVRGDFAPGFFVEHFVKDMAIALEESARMGITLPGLALSHQLYSELMAQGGARQGTQALQLALARMSGMEWGQAAPG